MTSAAARAVRLRRADLANPADLAAAADLIAAFEHEEDGTETPWSIREGLGPHLRRRASFVLLAELDGEAVGVLIAQRTLASFRAVDSCNIHDVFVAKAARGRGLARALMHAAEDHARALGCAKMTLEVNTDNAPALALYRSLGYGVSDGEFPSGATLFVRKPL